VLDALADDQDHRSLPGVVDLLEPEYVVMRPFEYDALAAAYPTTAARYRPVQSFDVPDAETPLSRWGVTYINIDRHFVVLRRRPR
jgi:hypothetical protein